MNDAFYFLVFLAGDAGTALCCSIGGIEIPLPFATTLGLLEPAGHHSIAVG